MDHAETNRAMNEGAKRLALQVRPTEPGSWTRLLELAASSPKGWGGYDLVALLTVAYEIGHEDGESERDMYGLVAQLRELCDENMTDSVSGGRTDAGTIWPSAILAILDQPEKP